MSDPMKQRETPENMCWFDPFTEDMLAQADREEQLADQAQHQRIVLEALAECARAGANPTALEVLAEDLGVRREWDRVRP